MNLRSWCALALSSVWTLTAMAAEEAPALTGDAAKGKAAYAVCAACHGPNAEGNAALNAPRLIGQEAWYLDRQLKAYREGHRGTKPGDVYGMQMRPMALAVSAPQAVADLIAYITSLTAAPAAITVTGDAEAGKAAYAVCAACHGANAEGLEQMGGPRLAGQDDWYLVRQIANYKKGLRGYHPSDHLGRQMAPMVATLADDAAIANVVAYINTLR